MIWWQSIWTQPDCLIFFFCVCVPHILPAPAEAEEEEEEESRCVGRRSSTSQRNMKMCKIWKKKGAVGLFLNEHICHGRRPLTILSKSLSGFFLGSSESFGIPGFSCWTGWITWLVGFWMRSIGIFEVSWISASPVLIVRATNRPAATNGFVSDVSIPFPPKVLHFSTIFYKSMIWKIPLNVFIISNVGYFENLVVNYIVDSNSLLRASRGLARSSIHYSVNLILDD